MWQLADYAESHGQRESALLGLSDAGFSARACLDFDLSVRSLKRWADERGNETEWGTVPEPPKGKSQVPKYTTLADVLDLDDGTVSGADLTTPDADADAQAAALLAALQSGGSIDWDALGFTP
jgi:hypothetical protein